MHRQAALLSLRGLADWILAIWIPCCSPIIQRPTSCKIYQCSLFPSMSKLQKCIPTWSGPTCFQAQCLRCSNSELLICSAQAKGWEDGSSPLSTPKSYTQEENKLVLQPIIGKTGWVFMLAVLLVLTSLFSTKLTRLECTLNFVWRG